MRFITIAFLSIPIFWTGYYTFNFGRWCLKQKNLAGAIMVFMLASASMVIPLYMLIFGLSLNLAD